MTTPPPWIPTPEALLPDPATLLGLFLDVPAGNIGADDMRALVQAAFSALFWQQTTDELLAQQVIDVSAVVSGLLTDSTAHDAAIADLDARLVIQEARP